MVITDTRWDVAVPRIRVPVFDVRGDSAIAQLVRFAGVGGLSNIVYFAAFFALASQGNQIANIVGAALSTALANELHRRMTFHASDRVTWFAAQWEGGALAVIGLAFSATAIAALNFAFPTATDVTVALLVIAVSAAVGGARFLALRGWVF
ncbi:GtrA family protein [Antrihabitans stalactiti]|uniref:GtrA family protein n=1 Tax=Antrihabitans stalactiti TaxID=2584121 RepID=A0A848KQ87_9NOCA|nr:GtrA family protein [Antrihabitans stalactiti]NMN98762.1 GtrA family protein [Antrihabitans stalactiti]